MNMNVGDEFSVQHRKWRVGGHWGKTIVAMDGDGSTERHPDDALVGMMLSDAVAASAVRDHNEALERRAKP